DLLEIVLALPPDRADPRGTLGVERSLREGWHPGLRGVGVRRVQPRRTRPQGVLPGGGSVGVRSPVWLLLARGQGGQPGGEDQGDPDRGARANRGHAVSDGGQAQGKPNADQPSRKLPQRHGEHREKTNTEKTEFISSRCSSSLCSLW